MSLSLAKIELSALPLFLKGYIWVGPVAICLTGGKESLKTSRLIIVCMLLYSVLSYLVWHCEDLSWGLLYEMVSFLQVPIQFWQYEVPDIRLHTEVKAGAVQDYACDEPILPPYLTLTVKGAGSSEVTADMNCFREYNKLYYENFIYIAATFTFSQ